MACSDSRVTCQSASTVSSSAATPASALALAPLSCGTPARIRVCAGAGQPPRRRSSLWRKGEVVTQLAPSAPAIATCSFTEWTMYAMASRRVWVIHGSW